PASQDLADRLALEDDGPLDAIAALRVGHGDAALDVHSPRDGASPADDHITVWPRVHGHAAGRYGQVAGQSLFLRGVDAEPWQAPAGPASNLGNAGYRCHLLVLGSARPARARSAARTTLCQPGRGMWRGQKSRIQGPGSAPAPGRTPG